jgi:orotidine-5'-phosphate decarboxylase
MEYDELLKESASQRKSIVCMGLDFVVDALPEEYKKFGVDGFIPYFSDLLIEMKDQRVFPGAFKPNQGFYSCDNVESGTKILKELIVLIKEEFPMIPVILDFKRGDIAKSSENYAIEGFTQFGADAVTISPFMGYDSVNPFIEIAKKEGKCVYILNRTSNKGAKDFQNLLVSYENKLIPLYEVVAHKIIEWSNNTSGLGAVVGATSLEELSQLAKIYAGKDVSLLIPGVGSQGGSAKDVVSVLQDSGYDLGLARINSSSGLTHPWAKQKEPAPHDFAKICVVELEKLNQEINYKC